LEVFIGVYYRRFILKKAFAVLIFLIVSFSVYGQSGSVVTLDAAISNAALQIQDRLDQGTGIIVYQFLSQDSRLSEYILKELFNKLVNYHKFYVLDRSAQEVIDAEIDFQFNRSAGMISDDSLLSLTSRIGAGAIVTGSLEDIGNEYRFRIRVIGTETTMALVSYVGSVNKNDRRIRDLTKIEPNTGEKIGTGALNILLGLGSYIEGDISGGITLTTGYVIAAGLFVIEATLLDWDNPLVGVPATAGFAVAGVTLAYGFIRPFIYNYSPKMALVTDNIQPRIVLTSDRNLGFNLTYTINF